MKNPFPQIRILGVPTYTGRGLYSNTSDEGVKVAAASVAGQKNTCEVASNNV